MPRLLHASALVLVSCAALAACAPPPGGPPDDDDGGPGAADACDFDVEETGFFVEVLALREEGGDRTVRIARRPGDGPTVGETFALELLAFSFDDGAEQVCVTDPAALAYEYGHHNWDERATTEHEGTTFLLTMQYLVESATWLDALTITTPDSEEGPIALEAVACDAEGPGAANACLARP